jgi:hypothetical protein
MKCENCGCKHDGSYGSGRFCSTKCSRGFSTKAKRKEINEKVSKSLKEKSHFHGKLKKKEIYHEIVCKGCKTTFSTLNINQKYCSKICVSRYSCIGITKSDETKLNMKLGVLKSYKNGRKVFGGTTKWYKYKNIKVQGTYELRTCKILDKWKKEKKIKDWEYTNDRVQYIGIDKKKHTYLLDFKVLENDNSFYYLETKGWEDVNDKLKWKAVKDKGDKLVVWFGNDIEKNEL